MLATLPRTPPLTRGDPHQITARRCDDVGTYVIEGGAEHRAFVSLSPCDTISPRPRTQVDFVIPPLQAFHPAPINGNVLHYKSSLTWDSLILV